MDKVTSELVTTEQIVHHFYCDECGELSGFIEDQKIKLTAKQINEKCNSKENKASNKGKEKDPKIVGDYTPPSNTEG